MATKVPKADARPRKGDETFTFLAIGFNIRRAMEIIGDRLPNSTVCPQRIPDLVRINEEYALSDAVDVTKPGIIASLPGAYGQLMIDGHHRAFKAAHQGLPSIQVHVLTEEESRDCCYTPAVWAKLNKEDR